jgi:glycosyltransferase involved in cell wall biosynthesis
VVKVSPPSFLAEITEGVPAVHRYVAAFERMTISASGLLWKLNALQKKVRKSGRELVVLFSDLSLSPLALSLTGFNLAIFINDCISLRAARGDFAGFVEARSSTRFSQQIIYNGLLRIRNYIVPSQSTAEELRSFLGSATEAVVARYCPTNGFAPLADTELRGRLDALWRERGIVCPNYFLHVGRGAWYKNREGLLQMMRQLKARRNVCPALVFAGEPATAAEINFAHTHGFDLYSFSDLTPDELQTLYGGALGLVFPSVAEGFGRPVLEALLCKTPVVISDAPALGELFGEAAALVLPAPGSRRSWKNGGGWLPSRWSRFWMPM